MLNRKQILLIVGKIVFGQVNQHGGKRVTSSTVWTKGVVL